MTNFREDLEYWTDEIVVSQATLEPLYNKLRTYNPENLTPEDLGSLCNTLDVLRAQIHWLDQTVNHYPKPKKKFWQFWKK